MSRFTSSMTRGTCHTSAFPLADEVLRRFAPSIFAAEAHHSRSERYSYIPTINVLDGLRKEGFQPFAVAQSRCRSEGKKEFTKHMLRLRRPADIATQGEEVPEIILLNSHDGTSSYQMKSGMFRFVCFNGMVCGNTQHDIKVKHSGNIVDNVIEGAFTVVKDFEAVTGSVAEMKALTLSAPEQTAFAEAALTLRFDTEEQAAPVTATQMLLTRRHADAKSDLWTTFNRVQENAIRGGLNGRNANGQRRATREVQGIDQNIKLNRALWMLAESMKQIKQAA